MRGLGHASLFQPNNKTPVQSSTWRRGPDHIRICRRGRHAPATAVTGRPGYFHKLTSIDSLWVLFFCSRPLLLFGCNDVGMVWSGRPPSFIALFDDSVWPASVTKIQGANDKNQSGTHFASTPARQHRSSLLPPSTMRPSDGKPVRMQCIGPEQSVFWVRPDRPCGSWLSVCSLSLLGDDVLIFL